MKVGKPIAFFSSLTLGACLSAQAPSSMAALSVNDVDLLVPTSSPRVATKSVRPGAVTILCAVSGGALNPCKTIEESRPGLGKLAANLVETWEARSPNGSELARGSLVKLQIAYPEPHCVELAGGQSAWFKCIPY
jgi:hypothetical protein